MIKKKPQEWLKVTKNGLFVAPGNFFIDPNIASDTAVVTHAHADHARSGHKKIIATPETLEIMKVRFGNAFSQSPYGLEYGRKLAVNDVKIWLAPAGHVLGSSQIVIEHEGARVVVSGDYKRQRDPTCSPFEAVTCDVFITEATFGLPVFQHPDPQDEMRRLLASIAAQPERCHVIGAYALGKAQRVIKLLREAGHDAPVYLHGAQEKLCAYYQAQGIDLGDLRKALDRDKDSFRGHVVVAPPSALRDRWSRRLPDPMVCQASGWMTIKQRAKQSGVELPLVISDHADWNELTGTISATGAETVWVTHGREDALVHWCRQRGLDAEPLYLQGREEDSSE